MSESQGADMNPCRDGCSPPSPLDVDDLLAEILLRLPPLPSSLPRANAVCLRWRRLITDPQFLCRFRVHHRTEGPPVIGSFVRRHEKIVFRSSILNSPDRIPPKRFDLCISHHSNIVLDCRHGRVLLKEYMQKEVVVCDPITGEQRHLPVPLEFKKMYAWVNGAVLCANTAHDHVHSSCQSSPFKVALMSTYIGHNPPMACVYSSETGTWGNVISAAKPYADYYAYISGTLIGNALYWVPMKAGILQVDLDRQSLSMIVGPPNLDARRKNQIIKVEDGDVGLVVLFKYSIKMWQRKVNCQGVATWLVQ